MDGSEARRSGGSTRGGRNPVQTNRPAWCLRDHLGAAAGSLRGQPGRGREPDGAVAGGGTDAPRGASETAGSRTDETNRAEAPPPRCRTGTPTKTVEMVDC